jgi:hypothetical protein
MRDLRDQQKSQIWKNVFPGHIKQNLLGMFALDCDCGNKFNTSTLERQNY